MDGRFHRGEARRIRTRRIAALKRTGVVGVLKGAAESKTIGLRADMDAVPIRELNDVPLSLAA